MLLDRLALSRVAGVEALGQLEVDATTPTPPLTASHLLGGQPNERPPGRPGRGPVSSQHLGLARHASFTPGQGPAARS